MTNKEILQNESKRLEKTVFSFTVSAFETEIVNEIELPTTSIKNNDDIKNICNAYNNYIIENKLHTKKCGEHHLTDGGGGFSNGIMSKNGTKNFIKEHKRNKLSPEEKISQFQSKVKKNKIEEIYYTLMAFNTSEKSDGYRDLANRQGTIYSNKIKEVNSSIKEEAIDLLEANKGVDGKVGDICQSVLNNGTITTKQARAIAYEIV